MAITLALLALLMTACGGADTLTSPITQTPSPLKPLGLEVAFPKLKFPQMVHLTHAMDGTDRIFVVLKAGRIVVFPNDTDASEAKPFLDIRAQVDDSGWEEGLLGLTFDPNFASNGYFYLNYTTSSQHTVISRFSTDPGDPNRADPDSELVLLRVEQPFDNHNGGALAFGPDGYLYVGLGDGGALGDPSGNGQNLSTLLGKMLRIDVSRASEAAPYRIPPDNPFTASEQRKEIWAYGLRNPWRFSFDRTTGALWVGDVGEVNFEEIDIILPGRNYGWNRMEGLHCHPRGITRCDQTGLEMPVFEYPHPTDESRFGFCAAVIGGSVYRGSRFPSLYGAYVYADHCSGEIWALRFDDEEVTEHLLVNSGSAMTNFISSLGEDEAGEIYILSFDERIYRLKEFQ